MIGRLRATLRARKAERDALWTDIERRPAPAPQAGPQPEPEPEPEPEEHYHAPDLGPDDVPNPPRVGFDGRPLPGKGPGNGHSPGIGGMGGF